MQDLQWQMLLKKLIIGEKVHNENWVKVWASYNTGWSYNTKTGLAYSSDVFDIIKKLKYEYKL